MNDATLLTEAALDRGAMQKPSELGALIELLQGERLVRVLEIGTARGGTLLVWCRLAAPNATIVSVDLPGGPFGIQDQAGAPDLGSLAQRGQELHLLRMDSGWADTRRDVERLLCDRPIDLLYIDGDHTYYGVRTDFLLYAPLVRNGGLVVLHDINSSSADPAIEVDAVWQQLKRTYESQEIIHHDPPPTFGGFGILRWSANRELGAIDPAPDGTGFTLPDLSAQPMLEAVVDVETTAGPLMVPDRESAITSALRTCGVWEPAETHFLRSTLRAGQTFVDVGADVGYFSVLASKLVGPTGSVIAVEPRARSLDLLQRNLARNGCANACVVPFAARSVRGWMSVGLDEENGGADRLVAFGQAESVVRCVRLDDILPENVDVVRIDASGFDDRIVEGLERTRAANPQLIVIAEISMRDYNAHVDPASVLARFETLGYRLSVFDDNFRLRSVSREEVPGGRGAVFSVILRRAEKPNWGDGTAYPARVEDLAVTENAEGLTLHHPGSNRGHHLNDSATLVFDLCTGETSAAGIAEAVRKFYELREPPVTEVQSCLDRLWEAGLVR